MKQHLIYIFKIYQKLFDFFARVTFFMCDFNTCNFTKPTVMTYWFLYSCKSQNKLKLSVDILFCRKDIKTSYEYNMYKHFYTQLNIYTTLQNINIKNSY